MIRDTIPTMTNVGYCQMIDSASTELPTVYTAMKRSQEFARQTGQESIDVVFDQAIYAKAQEIKMSRGSEFDNVVLRLGPLHTAFMYLHVLGKRFGDAGFSDLVIECAIIAPGSMPGILNGHHYNRSVRVHKIFMEALERVRWMEFGSWIQENAPHTDLPAIYNVVTAAKVEISGKSLERLKNSAHVKRLFDLYADFIKYPRGPMDEFWDSYISMVRLLLRFNRSIRVGNWSLNKQCIREILPWADAYDCGNYSRYLPIHFLQMLNLPGTHPAIHDHLENGQFGVQRSSTNAFGKVGEDMAIEQTLNKSTKGQGGIKGFTLNDKAVQRWLTTAPERVAITENTKKMAGMHREVDDDETTVHKEMTKSRIKKDEEAVRSIVDKLLNVVVNPFKESQELVSLTSGVVAPENIQNDLLKAKQVGENSVNETIKNRLLSLNVNLHDPMPKHNLGTFSKLTESKTKSKKDQRIIELKADRNLFARLLVIAKQRNIDLDDVLTYELGPFPWSISAVFGTMQKTTKSLLSKVVLKEGDFLLQAAPPNSAYLIDMMAFIQRSARGTPKTFGGLADKFLRDLTSIDSKRIDLVCDRYPEISIKSDERESRKGTTGTLITRIVHADQKVEQLPKFLKHGQNKENLISFLLNEWQKDKYAQLIGNKQIVITCKEEAYVLTVQHGKVRALLRPELCTKQEEADTRLFLHAQDCSRRNFQSAVLQASDTDIIMMACFHQWNLRINLVVESIVPGGRKLIDIKSLCQNLGKPLSTSLLPYHALTGCDSVSSFSGRGKKDGFAIMKTEKKMCQLVSSLGDTLELSGNITKKAETFVCRLYGYECDNINAVRLEMFTEPLSRKKGPPETQNLPPTSDALCKHIQRANYQAYIWKNALDGEKFVPLPDGHGWLIIDKKLYIDWMDNDPAPVAVLENISCGCTKDCSSRQCGCNKSGFQCTDACRCSDDCINVRPRIQESDSEASDEEPEY